MPTTVPIVDMLDAISLQDMDSVALLDRVDTKYVIAAARLAELLEPIAADYRVLEVESVRWSPYRTLYFDTPGCECYMHHHNGKLNRFKCRIREYTTTGACFLEIKTKTNKGRTTKRRLPVEQIEERFAADQADFVRAATGRDLALVPQMWSHFKRLTLVHRTMAERVTVDLELEFHSGGRPSASLPGVAIVEIKQDRDNRHSPFRDRLRRTRIRPTRVSKYCLGSLLLKPELKSNRFKARLRELRRFQ